MLHCCRTQEGIPWGVVLTPVICSQAACLETRLGPPFPPRNFSRTTETPREVLALRGQELRGLHSTRSMYR